MKAEEGMNANQGKTPHRLLSHSCLTPSLDSVPYALAAGEEDKFPLQLTAGNLELIFPTLKAATPQTTSSLLLDGESLICPSGGFLEHFGEKGHFPCEFSLLSAIYPGPALCLPPSALGSQGSFI